MGWRGGLGHQLGRAGVLRAHQSRASSWHAREGGGHSVGLHKHTSCTFLSAARPWALHLFGKISTEEVIMGRTEPGLRGPDSSLMKMSLFLTPGEKDVVEAILTGPQGPFSSPRRQHQFGDRVLALHASFPTQSDLLSSSSSFPVPHLAAPVPPGIHEFFSGIKCFLCPLELHSSWQYSCSPVPEPRTGGHAHCPGCIIDRLHRFAHTCPWSPGISRISF